MILRDLMRVLGSDRRDGRNLTADEAYRAFATILSGAESEIRIGAFLTAMRWKGVTVEEFTGFARAAREQARIPCNGMPDLVCVCPPHDGLERRAPLETAAALIAAAAGVRVLIISDRCVPPRRGLTAANVLEHLGASMTWDPSEAEDWVARTRFAAVSATGMLPPLLALRRVRAELGVRTALSTIEKLLAPASAALVAGAWSGPVLGTAVECVQSLGHRRAIVVQGLEGSVLPSLRRRSRGIELAETRQSPLTLDPADFGFGATEESELPLFGPPEDGQGSADVPALVRAAGETVHAVLAGATGTARDTSLLCAALLLKAAGRAMTLAEGVDAAMTALDTGGASEVLARVREACRK